MRYCGNCGTALDAAAISNGVCPTCGVALDPATVVAPPTVPPATGDLQETVLDAWNPDDGEDRWGPTVPMELRLAPNAPMSLASARPTTQHLSSVTARPAPTNPWAIVGLGVGLGAALLLVVACTLSFLTMGGHSTSASAVQPFKTATLGATATDAGLGFTTQAPDPTPLPYTAPSPLPTDTPYGGIPTATTTTAPVPTQPGGVTPTPTFGTGQTTLVIGPLVCKSTSRAQFTLTVSGGGTLLWQAYISSGPPVLIQPANGILTAGKAQTVDVKGTLSSPVTITIATNAGNQGGSITVQC